MNKTLGASAGLVAFLTVLFHMVNAPPVERHSTTQPQGSSDIAKQSKPEKQGQGEKTGPVPIEGPWLATRKFFHSEGPEDLSFPDTAEFTRIDRIERCATDPACRARLRSYFGLEFGEDYQSEFVIATVPDPLHTRLALFTDSSLEAIDKAAFHAGWEFAGQWLPW
jgi:hypothetical protein